MPTEPGLLARIEAFYDAVPRQLAHVEQVGPLVLFNPGDASSWPYYVRPALGAVDVTAADVVAARARRRGLGLVEAFEWVHETTPSLREAAAATGLVVHEHPLMVLHELRAPAAPPGVRVARLDGDDPDLARATAVAHVGFAHQGTAVGAAGRAERDQVAGPLDVSSARRAISQGWLTTMAAYDDEGPLSVGSAQSALGVTEIVGVATLPSARRRSLGALVTATLVAHSRDAGSTTVFLSADGDDVARVYGRLGFERVATACIAEPPEQAGL